jgi:hypothetical protein
MRMPFIPAAKSFDIMLQNKIKDMTLKTYILILNTINLNSSNPSLILGDRYDSLSAKIGANSICVSHLPDSERSC